MSTSAGRVLMIPKGDYDATETYTMLDVVSYQGKLYVAKQTTRGNAPTNTTYWQLMIDAQGHTIKDSTTTFPNRGNLVFSDFYIEDDSTNNATNIYKEKPMSKKTLVSIAVTTPPTVTSYNVGDTLDLTGIVVTATMDDSSTYDVTELCSFSPSDGATLTSTDTSVTVSFTMNNVTKTATQGLEIIAIYGAEWDGTASSAWTRTDAAAGFSDPNPYYSGMSGTPSSPFDDIMPWAGMEIVEDAEAGTLVKIPKFYYKWTKDGTKMKLQISMTQFDGALISPAHADREDGKGERDIVYVSRYKCTGNDFKSVTSLGPRVSENRGTARTSIHQLGQTIWAYDFAMYWTIMMLYLVEYADWNAQKKIGGGCSQTTSPPESYQRTFNQGASDSMPYHTGTTSPSIAENVYGVNQYRHIESLWGNCWEIPDGIFFESNKIYCVKNPAKFGDASNIDGAVLIGSKNQSNGEASAWGIPSVEGFEYALLPNAVVTNNQYNTYSCDRWVSSSSGNNMLLVVGAPYTQSQEYGPFYMAAIYQTTSTDLARGYRLMKLP